MAIPAKLVFVRNRSKRMDYLVLISMDISLTEDEIIQLYGKCWDIEVFFKTSKSVLRLTGECRSLSVTMQCAPNVPLCLPDICSWPLGCGRTRISAQRGHCFVWLQMNWQTFRLRSL